MLSEGGACFYKIAGCFGDNNNDPSSFASPVLAVLIFLRILFYVNTRIKRCAIKRPKPNVFTALLALKLSSPLKFQLFYENY